MWYNKHVVRIVGWERRRGNGRAGENEIVRDGKALFS